MVVPLARPAWATASDTRKGPSSGGVPGTSETETFALLCVPCVHTCGLGVRGGGGLGFVSSSALAVLVAALGLVLPNTPTGVLP